MNATPGLRRWIGPAAGAALALLALYLVTAVYAAGEFLLAGTILVIVGLAAWVYTSQRLYAYRYLFPGIAAVVIFVVFPILYTVALSFSNYSSRHLLTYERARQYFLDETYQSEGESYQFTLYGDGREYRARLEDEDGQKAFVTPALALSRSEPLRVEAQPEPAGGSASSTRSSSRR